MHRWHQRFLGVRAIPPDLTPFEIAHFFRFEPHELAAIRTRRRPLNRLGAALHLGFVRLSGATLDAVEHVPRPLLEHLADLVGAESPDLATLRSIYRRRRTLFEHQRWAARTAGRRGFVDADEEDLLRHLRREATAATGVGALIRAAQSYLYSGSILLPGDRRLRDLSRQAVAERDGELFEQIKSQVPPEALSRWAAEVARPQGGYRSALEWLRTPPDRQSHRGLRDQIEKVLYLRQLGVTGRSPAGLPHAWLAVRARRMRRHRASTLARLQEPRRTMELSCFLHVALLEHTDAALTLFDLRVQALVRHARTQVLQARAREAGELRGVLMNIHEVLEDETLSDAEARSRLRAIVPDADDVVPTMAAAVRRYFASRSRGVRETLRQVARLEFEGHAETIAALELIRGIYERKSTRLPAKAPVQPAATWAALVADSDRTRALRAFEAATLLDLRSRLRNGSVWVAYSHAYQARERLLIPAAEWRATRREHHRALGIPESPQEYIAPLRATLEASLIGLAEAIDAGEVSIKDGELRIPPIQAEPEPPFTDRVRRQIFDEIGLVQLPDLMVAMDRHVGFTEILLGRRARNSDELHSTYAGLLARGTNLGIAGVVRTMPGLATESVERACALVEDDAAIRRACDAVFDFQMRHPVTRAWGSGSLASSDLMVLEASRHLWNARVDPRRRQFGVGTYAHVLDRWGVIYELPLMLAKRQAGAALEGMLRQTTTPGLRQIAVDSHGYTHFGMALAKLLGFDELPRLRGPGMKRLYALTGSPVPSQLATAVSCEIALGRIAEGWDQLMRVAASVKGGWSSAVLALERFGSDARRDSIHRAATGLGKLHRTQFLCDIATNPTFRRQVYRSLAQVESVHALQRAIHVGAIGPKRGRRKDELSAISGSLTLLTNLVLAWVTHEIQRVLDARRHPVPDEVLRHIAPVHFENINFRGCYEFILGEQAPMLVAPRQRRQRS